jgi:hypothetical protein
MNSNKARELAQQFTSPQDRLLWTLLLAQQQHKPRKARKGKPMTPPSQWQLEHWAEVCRYLDGKPNRAVAAPFPDDPPMSYPLLRNMARFKLVRHRNSDCTWQVHREWEVMLERLRQGILDWENAKKKPKTQQGKPFVVDWNIDTMYVNVLAEEVPFDLLRLCQQLKDQAQGDYLPVLTPWRFGDGFLNILPNGKAAPKTGGVSWGYILRNDLVEIRLRKTPLSGIVAMVHFLAKTLWLNGAKQSLDMMQSTLKTMWADPTEAAKIGYQLSQMHLCADIAHFPLVPDLLPRLVTHSIKRELHVPSLADRDLDDTGLEPNTTYSDDDDDLYYGSSPDEWDDDADPFLGIDLDGDDEDEFADEDDDEQESDDDEEDESQETRWDANGGGVHWYGQRIEGIGFSPKGALSAAWYDKILEERKSIIKKAWMRAIHRAGGWTDEMVLTRVEIRGKRPVFNELEVALGHDKGQRFFDDPYVAIKHTQDFWAFGVGLPPEHDHAPDVTNRGWIRLAVPDANDSNRTRWKTDPLWEVVQRVPWSEGLPKPLKRAKQAQPDSELIDVEIRGWLITRAMVRGAYRPGPASLSAELRHFEQWADEYAKKKPGLNFAEEVRERARLAGLPVPYKSPIAWPKRPRGRPKKRDA